MEHVQFEVTSYTETRRVVYRGTNETTTKQDKQFVKHSTIMTSIPRHCEECKQLVTVVKSIIFYCADNCVATLCPECARRQLAQKSIAPYVQLVSCPGCKLTYSNLNPTTTWCQLNAAVTMEKTLINAAIAHFKLSEYEDNLYRKLITHYRSLPNPLLLDLDVDEKTEDELRIYIIRAEMQRKAFPKRYFTHLSSPSLNVEQIFTANGHSCRMRMPILSEILTNHTMNNFPQPRIALRSTSKCRGGSAPPSSSNDERQYGIEGGGDVLEQCLRSLRSR